MSLRSSTRANPAQVRTICSFKKKKEKWSWMIASCLQIWPSRVARLIVVQTFEREWQAQKTTTFKREAAGYIYPSITRRLGDECAPSPRRVREREYWHTHAQEFRSARGNNHATLYRLSLSLSFGFHPFWTDISHECYVPSDDQWNGVCL